MTTSGILSIVLAALPKKNIVELGKVQGRETEMIKGMERFLYEKMLLHLVVV